jgi:hypothetical protein
MKANLPNFVLGVTLALCSCARKVYVLPVPDGGPNPSPPWVQGRISGVEGNLIRVSVGDYQDPTSRSVNVRLTSRTQLFTIHGGWVDLADLVSGQRVRVWLERPGPPLNGQEAAAAVIMLASKDPSDDWP